MYPPKEVVLPMFHRQFTVEDPNRGTSTVIHALSPSQAVHAYIQHQYGLEVKTVLQPVRPGWSIRLPGADFPLPHPITAVRRISRVEEATTEGRNSQ